MPGRHLVRPDPGLLQGHEPRRLRPDAASFVPRRSRAVPAQPCVDCPRQPCWRTSCREQRTTRRSDRKHPTPRIGARAFRQTRACPGTRMLARRAALACGSRRTASLSYLQSLTLADFFCSNKRRKLGMRHAQAAPLGRRLERADSNLAMKSEREGLKSFGGQRRVPSFLRAEQA